METENNNRSKKKEQTAQRIIDALSQTHGLLTLAAHKAGVSYSTVNRYARDYPAVQQAVLEAKESMLDFAEGKLFEKISKGDTASIIFFLKTKGKARGYIERYEHTGEDGKPMETKITVVSENAKKLTEDIIKGEGT